MSFDFNYNSYRNLLIEMKNLGSVYRFIDVNETTKTGFILRHDIDFDVSLAYEIALVEEKIGINSTFFFLTTSDFYNLNSNSHRNMLREISKMGHEIGLHFDPTVYGNVTDQELAVFVEQEIQFLQHVSGTTVRSISLHNPSIHNQYPLFDGYINAYDPKLFVREYYMSDSRKSFRDKEPYEFVQLGRDKRLQILFHPIHFAAKENTYYEQFETSIHTLIDKYDMLMKLNVKYLDEMDNESLLKKIIKAD